MYTVASPGHDPNPWGRGKPPNPNKCNSTLTSGTKGEMLTPDPNDWNYWGRSPHIDHIN